MIIAYWHDLYKYSAFNALLQYVAGKLEGILKRNNYI